MLNFRYEIKELGEKIIIEISKNLTTNISKDELEKTKCILGLIAKEINYTNTSINLDQLFSTNLIEIREKDKEYSAASCLLFFSSIVKDLEEIFEDSISNVKEKTKYVTVSNKDKKFTLIKTKEPLLFCTNNSDIQIYKDFYNLNLMLKEDIIFRKENNSIELNFIIKNHFVILDKNNKQFLLFYLLLVLYYLNNKQENNENRLINLYLNYGQDISYQSFERLIELDLENLLKVSITEIKESLNVNIIDTKAKLPKELFENIGNQFIPNNLIYILPGILVCLDISKLSLLDFQHLKVFINEENEISFFS